MFNPAQFFTSSWPEDLSSEAVSDEDTWKDDAFLKWTAYTFLVLYVCVFSGWIYAFYKTWTFASSL